MTEIRPSQGPLAPSDDSLFPTTQGVEGEVIAPDSVVAAVDDTHAAGLELKVRSQWSYARMRFFRHRLALIGLFGLVVIFGAGIFAGFVTPYTYAEIDLNHILQGPSHAHYFGTDALGRDEYTRVIWGIRTSMEVGVFVAVVSTFVGLIVGAVAGYYGGWLDNLLMRLHRPRADAAPARHPAHGDGAARAGQPVARLAHPRASSSGRESRASSAASSSPCARRSTSRRRRPPGPAMRA